MIIGISGAQSTGKTTLINMLKGMGYETRGLVARTVMKSHPINKDGTDDTQRAVIGTHLFNLDTAPKDQPIFMDRCLVDGLAFTLYGALHGKVSAACLAEIYAKFYNNINRYDYIFYLEPEFDIVPDGVRDVDNGFRNELCALFRLILGTLKVPVCSLRGSPEERVQTLLLKTGLFSAGGEYQDAD